MKISFKLTSQLFLSSLVFAFICIGCTNNRVGTVCNNYKNLLESSRDGFVHTVRWEGESLSIIAEWYTGNSNNWKTLANLDAKLNPTVLRKGHEILIPQELLKTRKPMPDEFVASFRAKQQLSSEEEDEAYLFGPKE